jgi:hypothetical protein
MAFEQLFRRFQRGFRMLSSNEFAHPSFGREQGIGTRLVCGSATVLSQAAMLRGSFLCFLA